MRTRVLGSKRVGDLLEMDPRSVDAGLGRFVLYVVDDEWPVGGFLTEDQGRA